MFAFLFVLSPRVCRFWRGFLPFVVFGLCLCVWVQPALAAPPGPHDGLPPAHAVLDRSTPRKAVEGLLAAGRAGDFARAAHYLDLRGYAKKDHAAYGPLLAQRLLYVLEREVAFNLEQISDDPQGLATGVPSASVPTAPVTTKGREVPRTLIVGHVPLGDDPVPLVFALVRFDDGTSRWIVAQSSVAVIESLYVAYGPRGYEDKVPRVLKQTRIYGVELWQWIVLLGALLITYMIGWVVSWILIALTRLVVSRTKTEWDDAVLAAVRGPLRLTVACILMHLVLDDLRLVSTVETLGQRISNTLTIVGMAWLIVSLSTVATTWLNARFPETADPNLHHRGLRTQLLVMRRVVNFVVALVAGAAVLLQFELVRNVGVSLLASAGLLGVVFGFAAQKWLAGVIAGIQISITQPIRIGDTVVIEKEQGVIEEINLTYVVVKIWDDRRMIVPIARFLEQPFENWTRLGTELSGTVFFQVDFQTNVMEVRQELELFCKNSPLWDGRTCKLIVTECSDRVITLRAFVSARNSDDLWDLRNQVREEMLRLITANPQRIPRTRLVNMG